MFLEISLITIPIPPVRMAAIVAEPHQCEHNPAVSVVGLPWWEMRRSLHQHPSVADTAFAHIISSQQFPALSTSISMVIMEIHFLTKHWLTVSLCFASVWRYSSHLFPQHRRKGDFLWVWSLRQLASLKGMQNPRLSVDYTRNAKLSFILTICGSLTCKITLLYKHFYLYSTSRSMWKPCFFSVLTFLK